MNKQKRKMIARIQEINTRFKEMADGLETEKRVASPDEIEERNALQQERDILQLRLNQMESGWVQTEREQTEERAFAEAVTAIFRGRPMPEGFTL